MKLFDDRLEILSPGKLSGFITLENMKTERYSRNPQIARVLTEFGIVRELNEGVKRIYSEMQRFYLKDPIYSEPNQHAVLLVLDNNIVMRSKRKTETMLKNKEIEKKWEQLNYQELLKGNTTGSCLTVCLDRKVVSDIYFPKEKHEDYICWLNILKQYNLIAFGINKILGTYRIGKKSISSNKLKSAIWNWKVYRKSQSLSILMSAYYMCFYIVKGLKKYK